MSDSQGSMPSTTGLGVVAVLFGVLLLASQGTELLKQSVILPGSAAELGLPADCRPDELEEEGLSLEECQLMVSSVRITLASSPDWFRPLQLMLSLGASLGAMLAIAVGIGIASGRTQLLTFAVTVFGLLLVLDGVGFIAAVNTGPLLRAQYLWPALLWFFIHLCLLAAAFSYSRRID